MKRSKRAAVRAMSADACRRIREALGLTQETLAAQLGVTPLTVLRWENGQTPISRSRALAIQAIQSRGVA